MEDERDDGCLLLSWVFIFIPFYNNFHFCNNIFLCIYILLSIDK